MSANTYPIYVDGSIHAPGSAHVRADDLGFLHGIAAFDTLLCENGVRRFERRHLARLEATCRALDIAPSPIRVERALAEYGAVLGARTCAVRTTITRGAIGSRPSLVIAARDLAPAPTSGAELVIEDRFALAGDALDPLKTVNRARYALARERAQAERAFDALLRHVDGSIVESSSANLWLVVAGEFVTPPGELGALDGVVRRVLLEELARERIPVALRSIALDDLARAEEIFLTNSTLRVTPVAQVRGVVAKVPNVFGDATRRALELIFAAEQREGS